ncbi:MAG TPA: hypothetical protein VKU39_00925 [Streptosporangiaceae bacterium]|nr:hypothetical protein [Streptosporangiaceae bacterium]
MSAVINIEHFDDIGLLVDAVDDAVGSAPCAVTASQRAEERFTDRRGLSAKAAPCSRYAI